MSRVVDQYAVVPAEGPPTLFETAGSDLQCAKIDLPWMEPGRIRPAVTIWFHQHLDLVWASGGNLRVERRFAEVSRLPYRRLPPLEGSAIDWQNAALAGVE